MQGMVVVGLIVEELSNINVKCVKYRSRSLGQGTCQARAMFVCVEVLRPSQPNGVMSSAVSLPIHTFTGQA